MPDGGEAVTIKVAPRLADIDAAAWDTCAGSDNPFVSHAFLSTLEDSGAASNETGWLPQHLIIEDEAGGLIGAVPGYLKSHSHGEYVFDWGWADAFERAGGEYYPKLQVSVPFSPVTGPRLLARPGPDQVIGQQGRQVHAHAVGVGPGHGIRPGVNPLIAGCGQGDLAGCVADGEGLALGTQRCPLGKVVKGARDVSPIGGDDEGIAGGGQVPRVALQVQGRVVQVDIAAKVQAVDARRCRVIQFCHVHR